MHLFWTIHSTVYRVSGPGPYAQHFVEWMSRVEQMVQNTFITKKQINTKFNIRVKYIIVFQTKRFSLFDIGYFNNEKKEVRN